MAGTIPSMSPRQPHRIELRLSDEDAAVLKRLAQEEGLPPATYLRWLLHQQAKRALADRTP